MDGIAHIPVTGCLSPCRNFDPRVQQVKTKTYRTKLVLRQYITKTGDKLRLLGIPAIADKLLQIGVAKITGRPAVIKIVITIQYISK